MLSLLLAGCSQKSGVESVGPPVASLHLHGSAYGGEQPVSGATIQLYAVGTTGDGSASTPLLTQVVTSDSNGEFTLAGDFQCPSASTLVYLTATGGNPGLPAGMTNPQLALMAALGSCGSLGSSTTINVNELTTVAAVWPLAPFMSSYSAIGSGSSDASALASAFAEAAVFADTTTGRVPGLNVPTGSTVPVEQIDTLADALASCTNSNGGVAGDGSACGMLFAAATPPGGAAPVNVIGAGMNLANNPTLDSSSLFGLVGGKSPFQPTLTSAPASLAVQLGSPTGGLSISTSALVFPAAYLNFSSMESFTITNNSLIPSSIAISIVGAGAADFSVVTNLSNPDGECLVFPLAPGETCTALIGFTPTSSGARNASALVEGTPANLLQSVALSGAGLAHTGSSVTLSPASLTFSLAGAPQPVTVTNNGMTPIAIGPITVSSIGSETNNCGAILAAQSICTIQVEVADITYQGTPQSGTLTVIDSGSPGVGTVSLSAPLTNEVSFLPQPINFGDLAVGVTSQANSRNDIFVEDDGSSPVPAAVTTSIVGPNASDFSVKLQQFPIEIHLENNLFVTFTPSGVGPRTATLVTNYGNIPLSGNGIPDGPSLTITPLSAVAGMLGVATPVPANGVAPQWTNTGSVVLTSSGSITGPDASSFSMTASGNLTIAPTQSVPFTLTFTPSHLGLNTATLTVTDATTGYSNSIPLTGYGEPDAPSVTPSSLDFGPSAIGVQSAAQTMTISAPGGDPVSVSPHPGSNFVVSSGTCAIQTPCQISVSFNPSNAYFYSLSYTVTDLVTEESTNFNLSGSGGVASVSLSSSSLTFAARDIGTTSIPQTVTLTNTGDATLTIAGETFSGANVGDFPIEANTCGSSLAAGANCTLTISFAPTASGARSAVLQIMSNAASSPDNIQLMGTAN